jgi:hypothetical protein
MRTTVAADVGRCAFLVGFRHRANAGERAKNLLDCFGEKLGPGVDVAPSLLPFARRARRGFGESDRQRRKRTAAFPRRGYLSRLWSRPPGRPSAWIGVIAGAFLTLPLRLPRLKFAAPPWQVEAGRRRRRELKGEE